MWLIRKFTLVRQKGHSTNTFRSYQLKNRNTNYANHFLDNKGNIVNDELKMLHTVDKGLKANMLKSLKTNRNKENQLKNSKTIIKVKKRHLTHTLKWNISQMLKLTIRSIFKDLIFFAGEHPAAMQHGGQLRLSNPPFVVALATLLAFRNNHHWGIAVTLPHSTCGSDVNTPVHSELDVLCKHLWLVLPPPWSYFILILYFIFKFVFIVSAQCFVVAFIEFQR